MQVTAKDTKGNEFIKIVTVQISQNGFCKGQKILDFGWPVQYTAFYLRDNYPFQKRMCIDAMGRNHKGHTVYISAEQMNKVIEKFIIE